MEQTGFPYSSSEMEKSLYVAALNNDVSTLTDLVGQDPNLLERTNFSCEDKNPLHIAAMQGHLEFVQEILQHKVSFWMCLSRDREGRNPLHLAAMYGQTSVLDVLIKTALPAALEKADGGGTILHLCVKYNQLEALKFLATRLNDRHFENAKNEDGMTILHLAIYYKQNEITKYLLEDGRVDVNVENANGETAITFFLAQSERGGRIDAELLTTLRRARAVSSRFRIDRKAWNDWRAGQREWYEKNREVIMVVASLIATMAFQAGVSPPGGVWSDDLLESPNPHRIGEAVMAQTHPTYYRLLNRANSIAFVSALATIIMLLNSGSGIPSRRLITLLTSAMNLSVTTIAIAYATAMGTIGPKSVRGHLSIASEIVIIVLMVWIGWISTIAYSICSEVGEIFMSMFSRS